MKILSSARRSQAMILSTLASLTAICLFCLPYCLHNAEQSTDQRLLSLFTFVILPNNRESHEDRTRRDAVSSSRGHSCVPRCTGSRCSWHQRCCSKVCCMFGVLVVRAVYQRSLVGLPVGSRVVVVEGVEGEKAMRGRRRVQLTWMLRWRYAIAWSFAVFTNCLLPLL